MDLDSGRSKIPRAPVEPLSEPSTLALRCCLALLAAAACTPAGRAAAQAGPACPPASDSARAPDLVASASVQAEELRFRTPPRAAARVTGSAPGDTVRAAERRNLPRPVQPGTTYRDVYVSVEVLGHLGAECLLRGPATAPDSLRPAAAPAPGGPSGQSPRPQNPSERSDR